MNYYELEYSIMNENGDETYSGTSSRILIEETSITVENLMPGTVYNFKTKVDQTLPPVCGWNVHHIHGCMQPIALLIHYLSRQ